MNDRVRSATLLIKPASGNCNLRCSYCFYHDEMDKRQCPNYGFMTAETLELIVKKALSYVTDSVTFAFQGGEPTLSGLDYYRKLVELVGRYNEAGVTVAYAIQTNGSLLTEDWAEFFKQNHFLVGVSLDGPKDLHDHYRLNSNGEGSWKQAMTAVRLLKHHFVDFNILTVITAQTARHVQSVYNFFMKNDLVYQQYIPCLDPLDMKRGAWPYSLSPEGYTVFLKQLFDLWYSDVKRGKFVYIRQFDNYVSMIKGYPPESCNMCGTCSEQWVVEADGSVYPCDFYVLDQWRLGSFLTDSFADMNKVRFDSRFIQQSAIHPDACKACKWYRVCRNGCKRERILSGENIPLQNYFCISYQAFLEYAWPRLLELAR